MHALIMYYAFTVHNYSYNICTGSDPFCPMFTEELPSTVCINSTNPPVLRTNVTVYDNTGDIIKKNLIPFINFCLNFSDFPQSCAPFTVYATTYTHCLTAKFTSKSSSSCMYA